MRSSCQRGSHYLMGEVLQWYQTKSQTEVAPTSQSLVNEEHAHSCITVIHCVVTLIAATHACCQRNVFSFLSVLREISNSQMSSMKERAELHLEPCGFDGVWVGRQHAQIPVILDAYTVLHCVIITDTPPHLASAPTRCSHYRTQTDSACHDWKFKVYRAVIFSGFGGNPGWDS